jgi:protein SCO1/2
LDQLTPSSARARRLALPIAVFLLGLLALGAAAVLVVTPRGQNALGAAVGGPFALTDQDGRTVTERDLLGAPYLVFFGFTHCPDVCPTTLAQASEVLRATGERGKRLRAVFLTVDPERDTPEVLKSYLASFDERIVGLTGEPGAVEAAEKAFRAYARKVPLKDGDYTMEHTALVYLMDRNGRFVGSFNLARPPQEAAAELLRHL